MVKRSKNRIKKTGEVFTPPELVNEILDKLPPESWTDPNKTWLDPACGNGNFLVEEKKRLMAHDHDEQHILENMIHGADIMPDNIEECIRRLWGEGVIERLEGDDIPLSCREEGKTHMFRHNGTLVHNLVCANGLIYDYNFKKENVMLDALKAIVPLAAKFGCEVGIVGDGETLVVQGYVNKSVWRDQDHHNILWMLLLRCQSDFKGELYFDERGIVKLDGLFNQYGGDISKIIFFNNKVNSYKPQKTDISKMPDENIFGGVVLTGDKIEEKIPCGDSGGELYEAKAKDNKSYEDYDSISADDIKEWGRFVRSCRDYSYITLKEINDCLWFENENGAGRKFVSGSQLKKYGYLSNSLKKFISTLTPELKIKVHSGGAIHAIAFINGLKLQYVLCASNVFEEKAEADS